MPWFLIVCPKCDAALQVLLTQVRTTVQCCQTLECKTVFDVTVPDGALTPTDGAFISRRKQPIAAGNMSRQGAAGLAALAKHNAFVKSEMPKVRAEHPDLSCTAAMTKVNENWRTSPSNPKNQRAGDDGATEGDATGSGATHDGDGHVEQEQPPMVHRPQRGAGRGTRGAGKGAGGRARGGRARAAPVEEDAAAAVALTTLGGGGMAAGLHGTVDAAANGGDRGDNSDGLTGLLAARQQQLDADAAMRVQVQATIGAQMDVGMRVDASLAQALGVAVRPGSGGGGG